MTDPAPRSLELLMRETDWLRAVAARLTDDPDRVEEVVQRTRVAALDGLPERPRSIRAWLRRVATNVVRQEHRERTRRERRERVAARPEEVPSSAELVERVETQRTVARAVLALDEPYRTTILLRFHEDLPPREISRRTGVPVRTVETRLRRGLERLRRLLDRDHGGDRSRWLASVAVLAEGGASAASAGGRASVPAAGLVAGIAATAVVLIGGWFGIRAHGPREEPRVERGEAAAAAPSDAPRESTGVRVVAPRRAAVAGLDERAPLPAGVSAAAIETGLRGRVLGLDGRPAAGAVVRVAAPSDERLVSMAVTRTGADGSWRAVGLPAGAVVRVRARTEDGACGERSGIEVFDGRVTPVPELPLFPGGTIRGTVRTDAGEPLEGARVRVGFPSLERLLRTDVGGHFDTGALLPGRYPVVAFAPGHAQRETIEVDLGVGDRIELDVRLAPASTIHGRVTDADGEPISDATIRADRSGVAESADDGSFHLDVFGAAPVTITVDRAGYFSLRKEGIRSGVGPFRFVLRGVGEIRGRAVDASTGEPVVLSAAEAFIRPRFRGPDRPHEWLAAVGPAELGADGSFRIRLEYGRASFRIEGRAPGYAPSRSAAFHHEVGEVTDGVVVRMRRGRRLDVEVRDGRTGAAVPGALVTVHALDERGDGVRRGLETPAETRVRARPVSSGPTSGLGRPWERAACDGAGEVRFGSLPDAPVAVVVRAEGYAPVRVDGVSPTAREVEPERLEVRLTGGAAIEGRLSGAGGVPLPSRVVTAESQDGARGEAVSDEAGRYRIDHLPIGRYTVEVAPPPRYRDEVVDEFFRLEETRREGQEAAPSIDVVDGEVHVLDLEVAD